MLEGSSEADAKSEKDKSEDEDMTNIVVMLDGKQISPKKGDKGDNDTFDDPSSDVDSAEEGPQTAGYIDIG
eukprot:scaffold318583_cov41-Prasinocladus_malaysianus.AAC.1